MQKIFSLFGWTLVKTKDFEDLEKLAEKLKILSVRDSLTGLYNRRGFMEFLTREISHSQRHTRSFSLVMVDVDYLKKINDTHGHGIGDEALKIVAEVLKQFLREEDISARLAGDEFIILMPETDEKMGLRTIQRVKEEVERSELIVGKKKVGLTISCGIVYFNPIKDDIISVLVRADETMYKAKDGGRNQVSAGV